MSKLSVGDLTGWLMLQYFNGYGASLLDFDRMLDSQLRLVLAVALCSVSRSSVVGADPAARAFDFAALLLALQAPFLRCLARARGFAHLGLHACRIDELLQPLHCITLILFLRAKPLRGDHDHIVVAQAPSREPAQALPHAIRQLRPRLQIAAQLHRARDFVDVLTTRPAGADEAQGEGGGRRS